ncbi:MAG TPA: class I SAM-dependent methyltransferase [Rhizomicrobium sp.]|jgi:ubiquinone/menaquinone biosynthesis C-methylase UbiE|nr:class I SAM-dependent methyltransferase [Rhizomicrobium sp.]
MSGNADQIEFWNGRGGQKWADQQDVTDRMLGKIGEAALTFAAAKPGEKVIDIGCGTGTTTMALADSVGASGQVTGVDVSKPMLGTARERAAKAGKSVAFVEADASVFPFSTEIDLVFSRFGVMFFDQPAKAFENIHRALKPTGRLAFVCWRAPQQNPWAFEPLVAAKPFLPPSDPPDPLAPGPFAFADENRIKLILTEAGFRNIRVTPLDTTTNIGGSLDAAAKQMLEIGPLARAAAEADDAAKPKIVEAVRAVLGKYQTPEGITPPAGCWLVAANA